MKLGTTISYKRGKRQRRYDGRVVDLFAAWDAVVVVGSNLKRYRVTAEAVQGSK